MVAWFVFCHRNAEYQCETKESKVDNYCNDNGPKKRVHVGGRLHASARYGAGMSLSLRRRPLLERRMYFRTIVVGGTLHIETCFSYVHVNRLYIDCTAFAASRSMLHVL